MRTESYKQVKPIMAKNPVEAATKFNEAMYELRDLNPTFDRVSESVFYIYYQKTVDVIESIIDEYNSKGIYLKCKECPYFELPKNMDGSIDKRAKNGYCTYHERNKAAWSSACEVLYLEKKNSLA